MVLPESLVRDNIVVTPIVTRACLRFSIKFNINLEMGVQTYNTIIY